MIKNKKQLETTKSKLNDLKTERDLFIEKNHLNKHTPLFEIGFNSYNELINDLETEIVEYEQLAEGNIHILENESFHSINKILIGARIAMKLTQKELADRLGIQTQQIQRYESTDYESADITRVREILYALGINLCFEKILIMNSDKSEIEFKLPNDISSVEIDEYSKKICEQEVFIFN